LARRANPNERYHYLLEHGRRGSAIAFDNPTIMGYDSDHPKAHGEVGKCGVAVDSLRDMEVLLDGIDPGVISTSMTINGPATIMFALLPRERREEGRAVQQAPRHAAERHPQGDTSRRSAGASRRARRFASSST
jgi:methylmalonyl-CoA mutase N-terminal domain/subunit